MKFFGDFVRGWSIAETLIAWSYWDMFIKFLLEGNWVTRAVSKGGLKVGGRLGGGARVKRGIVPNDLPYSALAGVAIEGLDALSFSCVELRLSAVGVWRTSCGSARTRSRAGCRGDFACERKGGVNKNNTCLAEIVPR